MYGHGYVSLNLQDFLCAMLCLIGEGYQGSRRTKETAETKNRAGEGQDGKRKTEVRVVGLLVGGEDGRGWIC